MRFNRVSDLIMYRLTVCVILTLEFFDVFCIGNLLVASVHDITDCGLSTRFDVRSKILFGNLFYHESDTNLLDGNDKNPEVLRGMRICLPVFLVLLKTTFFTLIYTQIH